MSSATAPGPMVHRGYRFDVEPVGKRLRVEFGGEVVAESGQAMVMRETRLAPIFYFPRADVRMELLRPNDLRTHCPFKGNASYWHVAVGERVAENAAWSYEEPFEEAGSVGGHIAFYWDRMDAWYEDGEPMRAPPTLTAGGNPFVDWLVREAPKATTPEDLVRALAYTLNAAGMPLWRLRVLIRTLHPQLMGTFYTWQSDTDQIEVYRPTYEVQSRPEFRASPFLPILRGEGGVRRRLDGAAPQLDYPILEELRGKGATDYVAMPLEFSDGQLNIITLVSQTPGGFTTADLGQVYEILPMLGRLLEVHALHQTAGTLLDTYLGQSAGRRVLEGRIKRGDGEDIHAVIWFSDLRDSTALSQTLSREAYLGVLDRFFDAMAGSVMDQGGEVLKYIGDAVLAIFPIEDRGTDPIGGQPEAAAKAVAAVRDAERRMAALNQERRAAGEPALGHGIALHRGDLTYGNIGAAGRLDFTVIGAAVNQASRIEGLCRALGESVLLSASVAESFADPLRPLGRHRMRGVEGEQELFGLPEEAAALTAA